jgi:7-carboxy-7-deazaguanine synthase
MAYHVKEIHYTLQGEGLNTGRPVVLLRFAGCNLWSGRETDRGSAVCRFCDTDFQGTDGPRGGIYSEPEDLAAAVAALWPRGAWNVAPMVVCTGGEPLLQLDTALVEALHRQGFAVALETNGTLLPPPGIDWICVSPKGRAPLQLRQGDELKLVFPQEDAPPEVFATLAFRHFLLQPMDGSDLARNLAHAVEYCLENPRWRLSLQVHKIVGIP